MQTSQPKPCPFCGKADDLSRNPFMGDVVCDACGASVDEDSWNNRPTEDALREALQWYASMSKRMGNASIAGDSQAILALMKDVAVDYGGRARAALAKAGD